MTHFLFRLYCDNSLFSRKVCFSYFSIFTNVHLKDKLMKKKLNKTFFWGLFFEKVNLHTLLFLLPQNDETNALKRDLFVLSIALE